MLKYARRPYGLAPLAALLSLSALSAAAAPAEKERTTAATLKVQTALDQKKINYSRAADKKRDEAIDELKKLIPKAGEARKAEMIFRLAELYWEKSKYLYAQEMDRYEAAYSSWAERGQAGAPPAQREYLRESEVVKQNALKLYERVLKGYPAYERNDELLFYLGTNEYEAGKKQAAVAHYKQLVKQFSHSRLLPDTYLQLGEHYFSADDVHAAKKFYELALKSKEPRVYNYALYKLAWCDYNLQEYQAGIGKLKQVIAAAARSQGARGVQLKAEALGDMARFYSNVDVVAPAYDYFKKEGDAALAVRYTTKLGQLYHEQGKWPLEIETYQLLLNKQPMSEKAPYLQASIVEAYAKGNDRPSIRQAVSRLVDLYRPGTPWYKAQAARGEAGKAAQEYAYSLTEEKLRALVTEVHRDAQKQKDVQAYRLARDIYAKYLAAFPDSEAAYSLRYYYAEVLWALKEWAAAAEQYGAVARAEGSAKEVEKYARLAAYNQILAYEKVMDEKAERGRLAAGKKIREGGDKGRAQAGRSLRLRLADLKAGKEYKEQPIPPLEVKLSEACDLYFKLAKAGDRELPAIKFKAAYIYYQHNHFVEAAKRYFEIIDRWPKSKLAKKSAHLILDSLNVQHKYKELASYADKFLKNQALCRGDKAFVAEVQKILEGADYLAIQQDEAAAREAEGPARAGALSEVAGRFSALAGRFPKSPYAHKALLSAALLYEQAGQLDLAIGASQRLADDLKLHAKPVKTARRGRKRGKAAPQGEGAELAERNARLLPSLYAQILDFGPAAAGYRAFAAAYPKADFAPDALYNAGLYYAALGEADKAIAAYRGYTAGASRPDAVAVYLKMCGLYLDKSDFRGAEACYRALPRAARPVARLLAVEGGAAAKRGLKDRAGALRADKALLTAYDKLSEAERGQEEVRRAAARAAYALIQPQLATYRRMKVTLKKKSLIAKLKAAEALACVPSPEQPCEQEGALLSVLKYGDGGYGICALTRMGDVYREVATSIRAAPMPRRLDADQQEIYRAELDNVALGPEEKGVSAFEQALKKAYELHIYNDCTEAAQAQLIELKPNDFPPARSPAPPLPSGLARSIDKAEEAK